MSCRPPPRLRLRHRTPHRRRPPRRRRRTPNTAPVPPALGLTGGLGAGKSTALAVFERLGAATLSTDRVVHDLYANDRSLRAAIVARWGADVAPDGIVDRGAIARRVFADETERRWLERLIWPLVGDAVSDFRARHSRHDLKDAAPRAIVVETPLLFEADLADRYDATIAVIAAEALRQARAERRGHQLVQERTAAQLSQRQKAARATYVVRNDGSIDDLGRQLSEILAMLGR